MVSKRIGILDSQKGDPTRKVAKCCNPHSMVVGFPHLSRLEVAVSEREVHEGFILLESSIKGSSTAALDYLIHTSQLSISREIVVGGDRFVVLDKLEYSPTGNDKTSICFSFKENRPALLWEILGLFAERGINLTKVDSRPTKEVPEEYIFLLDCEGHRQSEDVHEALDALASHETVQMYKLLGSYPTYELAAEEEVKTGELAPSVQI